MKSIWTKPQFLIGFAILVILMLVGLVVSPLVQEAADELGGEISQPPSAEHLFGTDPLGRDALLRTIAATRLTLAMAVSATLLGAGLGLLLGAGTALAGRTIRRVGARGIDLLVAFPPIIIALAVAAMFGPSARTLVIALGIALTPGFARLSNTLSASVETRDFVTIARHMGVPTRQLLRRHVLPNIRGPLLVLLSVTFATCIVALSGLSFLGLGVQAPEYDWGTLLSSGLRDLYKNPSEVLGPALGILLASLSAGMIGDSIADHYRARSSSGRTAPNISGFDAPPIPGPLDQRTEEPLVSVRDLHVGLRHDQTSRSLVQGVSFDIHRGEIVGLVGESGSGKSLTAMALARLSPSTFDVRAERVKLGELDLTDYAAPPPVRLALELGVVFQDPSSTFNPAIRIGAQLTETLRVHKKMANGEARRRAVEALQDMRVTEPERRMNQYPHELSGGLRQRAMIAMALLSEPSVLIADEPTTALDVTVQADVLRLLRQASRERGTAILFISHDITVVSALCDRVNVMYNGQIVETLSAERLRRREAEHPYTRRLLASAAPLEDAIETAVANAYGGMA